MATPAKAVLIVLDGFGIGKDSPFNAISNAKMPFYRELIAKYPHSQLITHGEAVGLPEGVMGNSEVGHMTMGAGRIIYQDLTRISKAIHDHEFEKNRVILETLEAGARKTGRVHFLGLLSDGGVHSHIDHLLALLTLAQERKVPHVYVHAFLDGRDTPPDSAPTFIRKLLAHPAFATQPGSGETRASLASLSGRFWAMDRDKRWDRVEKAYRMMTGQDPAAVFEAKTDPGTPPAIAAVQKAYDSGKSDEFVEPVLLDREGTLRSGDSVMFFNYRADRAREITRALSGREFTEFDRGAGFQPSAYAGMALYDDKLPATEFRAAFLPQNLNHIFGEWLEIKKLTQFRTAETEKYAHVTFFFNGGREKPFIGEDRALVASPRDVATYDLRPEMSAFEVAKEATTRLHAAKHDFVLMNFANADMVGHTGNYEAAIRAMETLDQCMAQVVGAAQTGGYHTLITADHGNAEEMRDGQGRIHTQHTLNPVPALWVAPNTAIAPKSSRQAMKDGSLEDIMPTLCQLMGLTVPDEVTGKSLLPT